MRRELRRSFANISSPRDPAESRGAGGGVVTATQPVTVQATAMDPEVVEAWAAEDPEPTVVPAEARPRGGGRGDPVRACPCVTTGDQGHGPSQFVTQIKGRPFVQFAGLLTVATSQGLLSLTERVTHVTDTYVLAEARAEFEDGRVFVGVGDNSPDNVGKEVKPHWRRLGDPGDGAVLEKCALYSDGCGRRARLKTTNQQPRTTNHKENDDAHDPTHHIQPRHPGDPADRGRPVPADLSLPDCPLVQDPDGLARPAGWLRDPGALPDPCRGGAGADQAVPFERVTRDRGHTPPAGDNRGPLPVARG